jgi:peptidoglycan hydrolase CwlO-like protein
MENNFLNTNICRMEESNTEVPNEVSHLHASIDELREEATPLQEDNNQIFYEYKALKEYYNALLM